MKTQRELWLEIAGWFDHYAETGEHISLRTVHGGYSIPTTPHGLCSAVKEICLGYAISDNTETLMQNTIREYRIKSGETRYKSYIWPCHRMYAKNRADLARQFAAEESN